MCIKDSATYLDIGSKNQDPNTAALNFTTCQELIDIISTKWHNEIEEGYKTPENLKAKLGFVWARNKNGKWQPYVVKEIAEGAFANWLLNPIHCSVIIPWTVDYVGEKAFDDASTSTDEKLHVMYAKRYITNNKTSKVVWEHCREDHMDWTRDKDWDTKFDMIYDSLTNDWVFQWGYCWNYCGDSAMVKLVPNATPEIVEKFDRFFNW